MVRVLIERRLRDRVQEPLQRAMREIRRQALHRAGYLSGETLRDAADPHRYVVISTWRSRGEWEEWYRSEERRRIAREIAPLLSEPERVTVLERA